MLPGQNNGQITDPFRDPPGLKPPAQDSRTREPKPGQGADAVMPIDANDGLDNRGSDGGSVLEGGAQTPPATIVEPDDGNTEPRDNQSGTNPDEIEPFTVPENAPNEIDEDRYVPRAGVYRPPRRRVTDPYQYPGYQYPGYQYPQGYPQQPGHQSYPRQQYQPAYQPIPGLPDRQPIVAAPPAQQLLTTPPTTRQLLTAPSLTAPSLTAPATTQQLVPVPPAAQDLVTSPPATQLVPAPSATQVVPAPSAAQQLVTAPAGQRIVPALSADQQIAPAFSADQQFRTAAQQFAAAPQLAQQLPVDNAYIAAVAPIRPLEIRTSNFYFGFFGGWSDVGELISETGLGQFSLDDGNVFGVTLGRRNGRNLRTEIEFSTRNNDVSSFTDGTTLDSLSGDISSYGGMANAYWEFDRFRTPLFQPYVGVGVGFISIDSDILDSNLDSIVQADTDNDTSLAFQYMVGLNYKAYRNVDLFAEYRFLRADTFRLDTTVGTSDRFNYRTDNVFLGLRWRF